MKFLAIPRWAARASASQSGTEPHATIAHPSSIQSLAAAVALGVGTMRRFLCVPHFAPTRPIATVVRRRSQATRSLAAIAHAATVGGDRLVELARSTTWQRRIVGRLTVPPAISGRQIATKSVPWPRTAAAHYTPPSRAATTVRTATAHARAIRRPSGSARTAANAHPSTRSRQTASRAPPTTRCSAVCAS